MPAVQAVDTWDVAGPKGEGQIQVAPIKMAIDTGFFGMLKMDGYAKTRTFKFDADPTIHPNMVPYSGEAGAAFNKFEPL